MSATATSHPLTVTAPAATRQRRVRGIAVGRFVLPVVAVLVFAFLYLPLIVVVLYSFSATRANAWPLEGYTFDWYRQMADDEEIRAAIRLSVRVGLSAAAVAVVLGTLAAFALDRYAFRGKGLVRFLVVLPITLPGIVTAVAMLSFFDLIGWPLSNWTLIIAHATFCITLVLNNVVARLGQLPRHLDEASADLGANPWQTFWRITFPLTYPAILAGAILAFTLSFDEIIVSLFLKGRDNTLPLLIWGRLRLGLSPEINATATVIIGVSLAGVLLSSWLLRRSNRFG